MTNELDERCAPGKKFTDGSCFSMKQLIKIGNQINKKFSYQKDTDDYIDTTNNNKKKILRSITNILKTKYQCDNQLCWLKLDVVEE